MGLILHAGCGEATTIPGMPDYWRQVRLDIDPAFKPDIVASIADLSMLSSGSFDVVYCSHVIEHLIPQDGHKALQEFFRVLKPGGCLNLACPDLEAVATAILEDGLDTVAYQSPCGPIAPLDMLYGYRPWLGVKEFQAHRTGFTANTLARLLEEVGFKDIKVHRALKFDLRAVAVRRAFPCLRPEARPSEDCSTPSSATPGPRPTTTTTQENCRPA